MIPAQSHRMSDPLRHDGSRAHADVATGTDRIAKIEQLLLVGLDHYFAARYELAINVWTRALFLDRSHARARAYIDRARSALAERQRESEELLQNGVAAFQRGEAGEARRLLQAAIDRGAPTEEALALLDRLNRFDAAAPADSPRVDRAARPHPPRDPVAAPRRMGGPLGVAITVAAATAMIGLAAAAAWNDVAAWRSIAALTAAALRSEPPVAAPASSPIAHEAPLQLPRRGEIALLRARALTAGGHLHDALSALDGIRLTDPQREDADLLRAEIQRHLLALTPAPYAGAPDRSKDERRNP